MSEPEILHIIIWVNMKTKAIKLRFEKATEHQIR